MKIKQAIKGAMPVAWGKIPSGNFVKHVLNELLVAHQKYLPQFKDAIEKLGPIEIKDKVVKQMMKK